MARAQNAMEVFRVLNKSNCRKCGEKTCLAFAGAVYCGTRDISECPYIDGAAAAKMGYVRCSPVESDDTQEYVNAMRGRVIAEDFSTLAARTGGQVIDDVLNIAILGKRFGIRKDGSFATDLHIIPWLVIPLMEYIINGKGRDLSGKWINYREIPGGREKYALFNKRCEESLKNLADRFTDFFDDIIHMFDGRAVARQFEADVSVVLYPLPKVPVMMCYWRADEGLHSTFNMFFDETVGENLGADPAFNLGAGIAAMINKIAMHHGF